MRAVDTNVLVRLIARDEPRQLAAAESFVSQGAWVAHLVLAEAVWVLTSVYGLKAPMIATAIQMLLDHRSLTIQEPEIATAALRLCSKRPTTECSDCLVLETARKNGHLPLRTFDRNLARLSGAQRI